MPKHPVKQFWPTAYHKGTYQGYGIVVEIWFKMNESGGGNINTSKDWYQFDTSHDPYYDGVWFNPVTLQKLKNEEFYITFVQYETVERYRINIERLQRDVNRWARFFGDLDCYGLVDRGGQHWQKLEKQRGHYATSD